MNSNDHDAAEQMDLLEVEASRSLLDQLLQDSRLYKSSQSYRELLDFISRMRNFAPFNALLLQIQKPGMRFAASALDWEKSFGAEIKEDARPLLILWPFGPVAFVYDVEDVIGGEIPEDVDAFPARGEVTTSWISGLIDVLGKKGITCTLIDAGNSKAGSIICHERSKAAKIPGLYELKLNRNQSPAAQFVTIAHELGHLFLGHLGSDKHLKIAGRFSLPEEQVELEAESIAYLLAARNGIESKSEVYLSQFVSTGADLPPCDIYQVTRAAGRVESCLGLGAHTRVG